MVEYTGANSKKFSFSGASGQLRGSTPTGDDTSGSSRGSDGSLTARRNTSRILTPSPPTRTKSNRPRTRDGLPPRPTRRPAPSPDYSPPSDNDQATEDTQSAFGSTSTLPRKVELEEGKGSGEDTIAQDLAKLLEEESEEEAQEPAQEDAGEGSSQPRRARPKAAGKKDKGNSNAGKMKAGKPRTKSKASSAARPGALRRPRRPRQPVEVPHDAPARCTRSLTTGRGGRAGVRGSGTRFGYGELDRAEREGRRVRRAERERKKAQRAARTKAKGKGKGKAE